MTLINPSDQTITQFNVQTGGANNLLNNVAPSATSGVPVISQGAASQPIFGTAVVAGGGTGATTLTGVLIGNGTSAVTGNPITQHDVLVGGTSNAITSVAPSATSGVALISQGAAVAPLFGTVAIAGGGTNATTFIQTNGIVTYNGTKLINYAGPQISSLGVYTNTTQPSFLAYNSGNENHVTGDNTLYTITFDSTQFNRGSVFAANTFTAPVTGIYYIGGIVVMTGISPAHISGGIVINSTPIIAVPATSNYANAVNGAGDLTINVGMILALSATNTVNLQLQVGGGAKVVNVIGTINKTIFYGYLLF